MRLRTLSYNIHKCIGGIDRRYDPDRIVEVIQKLDIDVAMLQEVDGGAARSNRDHQVDLLAERLGLRYRTWFPNVDVRGGGQYGNAILSRYPIIESTNIDLSIRFKKRRSALHAVLRGVAAHRAGRPLADDETLVVAQLAATREAVP